MFTVKGNLYSTSFCISAILEWEFRSDSISRCFCCWRLVRPAGEPAAEDDALLARGKSQLILLQSPGPRPSKAPAYSSWLSPVVPRRPSRAGTPGPAPSPTRRTRTFLAPAGDELVRRAAALRHHAAPSPGRARSDVAALGRAQLQQPFPLCRARGVYGAPAAAAGTATATAAGCYLYGEEEEEERELRDTSTQVKGKIFL